MRIFVAGVTTLRPFSAGIALDWLQVALGLKALGHEVYYLEEVKAEWCSDEEGSPTGYPGSVNRQTFRCLMSRFGLEGACCQIYEDGEATTGLEWDELVALSKNVDLLINMSGHLKSAALLENVRRRVYVDQDPVYTQLWKAEYDENLDFDRHDVFFTVGLNIGTPKTHIPDAGVHWHHMLPPVDLDLWPVRFDASSRAFTTIASWAGYEEIRYRGRWYGSKYIEFERFAELPKLVDQRFEIALKNHREHDPSIRDLQSKGWTIYDTSRCATIDGYRDFIQSSRAEIGIAQNAYVQGRSGWFSDRAAHYLASGKPVLAQSTGIEEHVPTGDGILTFDSMEEAVRGVEHINSKYEKHCRAARAFAEEHVDYRRVLPTMLELSMS